MSRHRPFCDTSVGEELLLLLLLLLREESMVDEGRMSIANERGSRPGYLACVRVLYVG